MQLETPQSDSSVSFALDNIFLQPLNTTFLPDGKWPYLYCVCKLYWVRSLTGTTGNITMRNGNVRVGWILEFV